MALTSLPTLLRFCRYSFQSFPAAGSSTVTVQPSPLYFSRSWWAVSLPRRSASRHRTMLRTPECSRRYVRRAPSYSPQRATAWKSQHPSRCRSHLPGSPSRPGHRCPAVRRISPGRSHLCPRTRSCGGQRPRRGARSPGNGGSPVARCPACGGRQRPGGHLYFSAARRKTLATHPPRPSAPPGRENPSPARGRPADTRLRERLPTKAPQEIDGVPAGILRVPEPGPPVLDPQAVHLRRGMVPADPTHLIAEV